MDNTLTECAAVDETVVVLNYFKDLHDPRQQGKVCYPLEEILLLCLLAVVAGAETITEIAIFGAKKLDLLRRFRSFRDGTSFAARQRLVLGQAKVTEKSNEIIAIPKLLDLLTIEGAIVTIDAMGCPREIAQKIMDKKADYILALKGNQGSLREDVELFVSEQQGNGFKDTTITHHETVDADHGRIETRTVTVIHDSAWLNHRHDWPGLKAVAIVESTRETSGKIETETRFYITSLTGPASRVGPAIRDHWRIENSLHWVMDMTFRDDECRVR